jgi:hypothetical protein
MSGVVRQRTTQPNQPLRRIEATSKQHQTPDTPIFSLNTNFDIGAARQNGRKLRVPYLS